jgi:hypothetical protein
MVAAALAIADQNPELAAKTISRALEKCPTHFMSMLLVKSSQRRFVKENDHAVLVEVPSTSRQAVL